MIYLFRNGSRYSLSILNFIDTTGDWQYSQPIIGEEGKFYYDLWQTY